MDLGDQVGEEVVIVDLALAELAHAYFTARLNSLLPLAGLRNQFEIRRRSRIVDPEELKLNSEKGDGLGGFPIQPFKGLSMLVAEMWRDPDDYPSVQP